MSFDLTPDTHITLRPSGVSSFMACPKKWAATTLMGYRGWGSFQTARGTGVHAGAEQIWTESMSKNKKIINVSQAQDAAVESVIHTFETEDIRLDKTDFSHTIDNVKDSAAEGAKIYCSMAEEIEIPKFVEHRMELDMGDNIWVKGTADYIGHDGIVEDIKTSSKKTSPNQHAAQLGVYAKLAKLTGIENASLTDARIQNVAYLKNSVNGHLLPFKLNETLSSYLINTLKERTILARQNPLEIDLLFPANPSSFLCNPKYCAYWDDCEAHG